MQATASKTQDRTEPGPTMVRIRPETRRKIERVASAKSWKLAEAFDQAADALLSREKIKLPEA